MIADLFLILFFGFVAGEIAGRLGLPKLIGMIIAGIFMGPYFSNLLSDDILNISADIRLLALFIILFKAGLGLDKEKILKSGSVAIRLSFMPAVIEATLVAITVRLVLGWEWLLCFLVGWIICAASPAVIVPLMLKLKGEGWGVKKGIPDLILAGGTASDAVAITMFGITLTQILGDRGGILQFFAIPMQVLGGILAGYLFSKTLLFVNQKFNFSKNILHSLILATTFGLGLLILGDRLVFSAFLAVMVMGFLILEKNQVLARRLRTYFDEIWVLGQIFLQGYALGPSNHYM